LPVKLRRFGGSCPDAGLACHAGPGGKLLHFLEVKGEQALAGHQGVAELMAVTMSRST
jgi:hypothetical protein